VLSFERAIPDFGGVRIDDLRIATILEFVCQFLSLISSSDCELASSNPSGLGITITLSPSLTVELLACCDCAEFMTVTQKTMAETRNNMDLRGFIASVLSVFEYQVKTQGMIDYEVPKKREVKYLVSDAAF